MTNLEPCSSCGDHEPACNFMWARLQELEQRYEQLEQVARNMYQKLWGNAYNEDPTLAHELRKNMADIRTEQYREQLEDWG